MTAVDSAAGADSVPFLTDSLVPAAPGGGHH